MKTYWTLEQDVLNYLGRKASDLPEGMLNRAINVAKDNAQRLIDFEAAQVSLETAFPFSLAGYKNVRLAVEKDGEKLPILARRDYEEQREWSRCLILEHGQLHAVPQDLRARLYLTKWLPDFVPYTYRQPFVSGQIYIDTIFDGNPPGPIPYGVEYPYGSVIEINGQLTRVISDKVGDHYTALVQANIPIPSVIELARLCQHPFLLDYAYDYLLLRSLYELNFFLKEEERAALLQPMMERALEQVILWNSSLVQNPVDVSLD